MRAEIDLGLTCRVVADWSCDGTQYAVLAIDFLGVVGAMVYSVDGEGREREGWLDACDDVELVLTWEAGTEEDRTRRAEAVLK